MAITLAGEAVPHVATAEQCIGTTEEIMLCGASERMLERRFDSRTRTRVWTLSPGGPAPTSRAARELDRHELEPEPAPLQSGRTLFIGGDR